MVRKIVQKESFRQKVQLCSFYNMNLWFPLSMSVYWFAYFFSNKRQYCVEVIGAVPHFGFHHNIKQKIIYAFFSTKFHYA